MTVETTRRGCALPEQVETIVSAMRNGSNITQGIRAAGLPGGAWATWKKRAEEGCAGCAEAVAAVHDARQFIGTPDPAMVDLLIEALEEGYTMTRAFDEAGFVSNYYAHWVRDQEHRPIFKPIVKRIEAALAAR